MNINELGDEYLHQEEVIRNNIKKIRSVMKLSEVSEVEKIRRRLRLLYQMARECAEIGNHLKNF